MRHFNSSSATVHAICLIYCSKGATATRYISKILARYCYSYHYFGKKRTDCMRNLNHSIYNVSDVGYYNGHFTRNNQSTINMPSLKLL